MCFNAETIDRIKSNYFPIFGAIFVKLPFFVWVGFLPPSKVIWGRRPKTKTISVISANIQ